MIEETPYELRIKNYSRKDLLSVADSIDREQYPERHKLVLEELAKRSVRDTTENTDVRFSNILDRTQVWAIIVAYLVMAPAILVLSVVAFFFPIAPVCMLLHKEFSNLGPIATFFWGLLFDIFILTPVFLILLLAKIGRVLFVKFVVGTGNQGRSE